MSLDIHRNEIINPVGVIYLEVTHGEYLNFSMGKNGETSVW